MEITIREISNYSDYIKNMEDIIEIAVEYQRWMINYFFDWKPESFKKMFSKDEWLSYYDRAEKDGTFQDFGLDQIKQSFDKGRWSWFLYENNKVAAMTTLSKRPSPNESEIQMMYVRPPFRGKKYSKILIEKAIKKSKDEKYESVSLHTFPFMGAAIHLYEFYGFKRVDYIEHSYMDKELAKETDSVFMELQL